MTSEEVLEYLRLADSRALQDAGIAWGSEGGRGDAEMALLLDCREDGRPELIQILRAVLLEGRTEVGDLKEGARIDRDLKSWFGSKLVSDPLVVYLKVALEALPFRLFVLAEELQDVDGMTPDRDEFWFELDGKGRSARVTTGESRIESRMGRGTSLATPDPRPWKGPAWRRFLGRRICWIRGKEVVRLLEKGNPEKDPNVLARIFSGFFEDPIDASDVSGADLLPVWLKLKWIEHLCCRVRGLNWAYQMEVDGGVDAERAPFGGVRIELDLEASEQKDSHRPATLPPRPRGSDVGETESGSEVEGRISCPVLRRRRPERGRQFSPGVELIWDFEYPKIAMATMKLHSEYLQKRIGGERWQELVPTCFKQYLDTELDDAMSVVFSGALSGSLASHNSVAGLSRESMGVRGVSRFLELLEHTLFRVAICDERVQTWWAASEGVATSAIQRRVMSVFLGGPEEYQQEKVPDHGYWGELVRRDRSWILQMHWSEYASNSDFMSKFGSTEGWPISAEILVIHQGVIDKWQRVEGAEFALELTALKDEFPWVVVTSGRGKPEQVPVGVRFIPFSGIQSCLVGERLDKLLLIRQITACGGEV